jgi:hypothetical protein
MKRVPVRVLTLEAASTCRTPGSMESEKSVASEVKTSGKLPTNAAGNVQLIEDPAPFAANVCVANT